MLINFVHSFRPIFCIKIISMPIRKTFLISNTSNHITSHHIKTHHIASHHIKSHHITSNHITSQHNTSNHITSHHNTSNHITSHHIKSHHITTHHDTSNHITTHHITTTLLSRIILYHPTTPSVAAAIFRSRCPPSLGLAKTSVSLVDMPGSDRMGFRSLNLTWAPAAG